MDTVAPTENVVVGVLITILWGWVWMLMVGGGASVTDRVARELTTEVAPGDVAITRYLSPLSSAMDRALKVREGPVALGISVQVSPLSVLSCFCHCKETEAPNVAEAVTEKEAVPFSTTAIFPGAETESVGIRLSSAASLVTGSAPWAPNTRTR